MQEPHPGTLVWKGMELDSLHAQAVLDHWSY